MNREEIKKAVADAVIGFARSEAEAAIKSINLDDVQKLVEAQMKNLTDPLEAENLAIAVAQMKLKHVVITSVDRDDLDDGGARQFVACIEAIRRTSPETTIEILTPDFLRKDPAVVASVVAAKPDIFNHNLETVPRLYPSIRPGTRYFNSLRLMSDVKIVGLIGHHHNGFSRATEQMSHTVV